MDMIKVSTHWSEEDISASGDGESEDGVNTHLLILEVEMRPILYVKSLHQQISGKDLMKTWAEVAASINANRMQFDSHDIPHIANLPIITQATTASGCGASWSGRSVNYTSTR